MPPQRDAFDILMKKERQETLRKAPKRKLESSFILCPLCARHISVVSASVHFDSCSQTQESPTLQQKPEPQHDLTSLIDVSKCNDHKHAKGVFDTANNFPGNDDASPYDSVTKDQKNAFSYLMQQSQRQGQILQQRIHLHDIRGNVSWSQCNENFVDEVEWTAKVKLKRNKSQEDESMVYDMELTISSSVPSRSLCDKEMSKLSLVQNQSRLSVPVLKSILQKSVRRKRPLPATKVAMELAEKSWSDLLRRLPIIILEDSTLHPDLPLLVWLMVADSKDFIPPNDLIIRVMQVVFEIASCDYKDDVNCPEGRDEELLPYLESNESTFHLWLNSPPSVLDRTLTGLNENCVMIIKSLMLRKHYGGMACDIKLLDSYINMWQARFHQRLVPEKISVRLTSTQSYEYRSLEWIHIPALIHKRARQSSIESVPLLVQHQLSSLSLHDTTLAGIDFHCSNAVEILLEDSSIVTEIKRRIQTFHGDVLSYSMGQINELVKECMWECSSSINHKRVLVEKLRFSEREDSSHRQFLSSLWDNVLKGPHKLFASHYVSSHLIASKRT